MPDITALAGKVAGVVALAAYVPYIISIFRGGSKPSKSTWWILALVGVMLYLSYGASGGANTLWVPMAYILGPFVVAILSLRFGEKGWTKLDSICIAGALLSIPAWVLTGSAFTALAINIFVDFLGIIPTLRKSYLRPWTEDCLAWGVTALASLINLFAVEEWNLHLGTYPAYMMLFNGLIFILLFNLQGRKKIQ